MKTRLSILDGVIIFISWIMLTSCTILPSEIFLAVRPCHVIKIFSPFRPFYLTLAGWTILTSCIILTGVLLSILNPSPNPNPSSNPNPNPNPFYQFTLSLS